MDFSIRELESISGIKAHTIRIWEQRYNFLKPSRTTTNIRRYSNEELKTLLTVALLNKFGYKISRIDKMQEAERRRAVIELQQPEAYNESLVNELLGSMIDLDSLRFESLLDEHISKYGIETTITELVFIFLEKVGLLWQTDRIAPVQEHIVSAIIRQKIVSAIERLPFPKQQQPLFLLFLPEGEHHEMGLLFVYYLLRRKNIPVIYLGANLPLKDIGFVAQVRPPQYIYSHLSSFPRQQQFAKFLTSLTALVPGSTICISGSAIDNRKSPSAAVRFLPSMQSVRSFIDSIPQSV